MVYTVKEIAKMLKASPETIKKMIYQNKLKAFKVGNEWRITEEALNELKKGN